MSGPTQVPTGSEGALIWCPFPDAVSAEAVAGTLLDEALVACANIMPAFTAIYRWRGARERSLEVGVLFKTRADALGAAIARIAALHPYDEPAVLGWRCDAAAPETMAWLATEVAKPTAAEHAGENQACAPRVLAAKGATMTDTDTDSATTDTGRIARKHGFSQAATEAALAALETGGGRQAQFNHPELGGMGQLSGGMIMIGDMFNNGLKARVGALLADLAPLVGHGTGSGKGRGAEQGPFPGGESGAGTRWPADLGHPSSSGAQDAMRYAVFPDKRRLAVERDGTVTVYDTAGHRITGAAQQQGGSRSLRFSTADGAVELADLRAV